MKKLIFIYFILKKRNNLKKIFKGSTILIIAFFLFIHLTSASNKKINDIESSKYDNPLPLFGDSPGKDIVIFVLDASSSMQDYGIHEQTQGIAFWNSERFYDEIFKFANVSYGKEGSPCENCLEYAKETGIIPEARFISDLPENIQNCLNVGSGYCSIEGIHNDYFTGSWAQNWCNSTTEPCTYWKDNIDGGCSGIYYPGPANIIVMKAAMLRMLQNFNSIYEIAVFTVSDSNKENLSICGNSTASVNPHGLLFDVNESFANKSNLLKELHADGNASLGEILYEVYLYLRGERSFLYPNLTYKSPIKNKCDRIHIIVISDGVYKHSMDTPPILDTDGDGTVVDEIAYKLSHEDLSSDFPGQQSAKLYSIYYILRNLPDKEYRTMGKNLMQDIADSGLGKYYEPNNILIIEDQLDNLIGDKTRTRIEGYTAGTQSWDYYTTDRNVYLVKSDTFDDLGSIDKYQMKDGIIEKIFPEVNPLAESGKKLRARSYENRTIYTIIPTKPNYGLVQFKVNAPHWNELRSYLQSIWGEKPNGVSIEALVNYIRGNDYYESWRHGNLRSRCWYGDCGGWKQASSWQKPLYLSNHPLPTGIPDEKLSNFAKELQRSPKVVIASTNNGIIHCFVEDDLDELWAFIPPSYLKEYPSYSASRWYRKDLTSRLWLYDLKISKPTGVKWHRLLLGAYGPTIKGIFALDISNHRNPKWLWEDNTVGYYIGQEITYIYQMLQPGYPNKQGGALLVIPSGYSDSPDKFLLIKHPISGAIINKINLNIVKDNEDAEIIQLYPKVNDCKNPDQQSNIFLFDDNGYVYEIYLCDLYNPKVNVYKPTPQNKEIKLANFQIGKYSKASMNYLIFSDGKLLKKSDIEDEIQHTLFMLAPHNKNYPLDNDKIAYYNFLIEQGNWITINGKESGKQYINIEFSNPGERLYKIWHCSPFVESAFISESIYYPQGECEQKVPHTSFLILPKEAFLIWKNKPWPEIRSEYFNHQLINPFIDTNNDELINENDLVNGKKVYGKVYNGFVADVRKFRNLKTMTDHLNILLIEDLPDDNGIYHSKLEHITIKAEPSYEILYKKIITIPNINKQDYPAN